MKVFNPLEAYTRIKPEMPDSILLFHVGDFYEAFHDDAELIAKLLGLTLTRRSKQGEGSEIPMTGFPYHSLEGYLAKLVAAGHKVAVIEPNEGSSPVQREGISTVFTD